MVSVECGNNTITMRRQRGATRETQNKSTTVVLQRLLHTVTTTVLTIRLVTSMTTVHNTCTTLIGINDLSHLVTRYPAEMMSGHFKRPS